MRKNVADQKVTLFAFTAGTNAPATGEAANLTFHVSLDDGAYAALAASPTEDDSTNAPGFYSAAVAAGECNADKLKFAGVCTTAGVVVVPAVLYTQGLLQEVAAKTALITSTGYTVSTPVDPDTGMLSLIAGDGYETAERIPTWEKTGYAGPTPTGTGTLRITTIAAYQGQASTTAVLEAAGTVTLDGTTITIKVPLTEAQTTLLQPGPQGTRTGQVTHKYQLLIDTEEGVINDDATEYLGNVIVTRRVSPAM